MKFDFDKNLIAARRHLAEIERRYGLKVLSEDESEAAIAEVETLLSDESILGEFADALLTVIARLERDRIVPEIQSSEDARAMLLAVIRHLFMNRAMLSKMGRRFAMFGARRIIQKQRQKLK